jgi:hypothetical protein
MKPRRRRGAVYTLSRKEKIMVRAPALLMFVAALAAPLIACAAEKPATPRAIAPPTRIPDVVDASSASAGETVNTATMPREVRRAVVADAAKRFKVAESSVVLVRAEQLTWSDGSLGCPEPGMMYTQMLVPGFRVVAKTSGGELTYHTDSRGNAKSCGITPGGPANKLADKAVGGSEPRTRPPRAEPDR